MISSPPGRWSLLESADLVLHATDQVFDFSFDRLPERHRYVGPLGIWEPQGEPPVYLAEPGDRWALVTIMMHGRSLLRVWLALARRGLYTHPLSPILDCAATERDLAARVGAPSGRRPLSVFRVGRSEPPARSHRLR